MANEKKLTDELEKTKLSERLKLILNIAPGCLFGFPPPNLGQIIDRVDCPFCRKMMNLVEKIIRDLSEAERIAHKICSPVQERNRAKIKKYQQARRAFILGRFAKFPELEKEPDYKKATRYIAIMQDIEKMEAELKLLSEQDNIHWGDEETRKISREVLGRFIAKDSVYVISL